MHIHSKILTYTLMILLLLSAGASYYRFMVIHDYVIVAEVDCDPTSESCFVWQCDPAVEGECTGDPEADTWYYKIATRNAQHIPECDPEDEMCELFACEPNVEADCAITLCTEATLVEQGIDTPCSNPSDFIEITDNFTAENVTPITSNEVGPYVDDATLDESEGADGS